MGLPDLDRKKLWAKAGNNCSYRYKDELCDKYLFSSEGGIEVSIGEECHIVGKAPAGPRYIENYLKIEEYDNYILLCANHHKIIDDNANIYTVDVLRQMKEEHETAVNERIKREEIEPTIIKDSTIITEAKNADEAIGMKINRSAQLSGVKVDLKAENVRRAVGLETNQTLNVINTTCSSCKRPLNSVSLGQRPIALICKYCGKKIKIE